MKLQRSAKLRVPVWQGGQPIAADRLRDWLQDPERLLHQLLSGEQLDSLGGGQFRYTPRPLELPGYRLAPQVDLEALWLPPRLELRLLHYRLPGMPGLERKARYRFSAVLAPAPGELALEAQAELELPTGSGGLQLPAPLLAFLGNQTLALIFTRLERRCRRNLGQGPKCFSRRAARPGRRAQSWR